MKKFFALMTILALTGAWNLTKASHIAGADLTYQCLGNNEFMVTLNLYRDCTGITVATTQTIDINSPCGSSSVTLPLDYSEEISQLCNSQLTQSTCSGGSLPGMEIYVFSGIITLDPQCDFWTLSWDQCCRNPLILNLVDPDTQDMYIQATVNTEDYPCDNSPTFNNLHIPYVCINSPVAYSYGVSEVDGDSLSYSLVAALEPGPNPLAYVFPYTPTEPIPGITIDPQTGLLFFLPTLTGSFTVVVEISQWDSNGNLIGTIMRDVQFVVIACLGNQPPDPSTGTIANMSGSAVQTSNYTIEMCETDNFCFDFTIVDPDIDDTLNLTTTVLQALPGATFTWTGANPVTGQICWTAPPNSAAFYSFIITADDDGCPVFGTQTYSYAVDVLHRTNAGPDQTICGPQVAQLGASGGSVFTWTALPGGDGIDVGVNFSCDVCPNPIADPNITTTYIVTSDLSGTCINSDTITVFVVPDFTFNVSQTSTSVCLGQTIQFDVSVNPNVPGYEFLWTPSSNLDDPTSPTPVGTYNQPGTYQYLVEVTSPDDCVHLDTTITVVVNAAYVPEFSAYPDDNSLCDGGSTQLHASLDYTVPSQCGPNLAACGGSLTDITVGTGTTTNTTTSYPAIYGNFWWGAKHQILFRADELWNMGFVAGTFVSIGWEIVSPITGNTNYDNWEIKMGCTTEDEMTSWISGLTTVYQNPSIQPQQGLNIYNLTTNYNWDGISNIVVETCFNNSSYDDNLIQEHTTTPFQSSLNYHADNANVCPTLTTSSGDGFLRPNTFFTVCSGVDTTNITYTWTPSNGLSDPNISDPTVTPPSLPSSYTITVEDTATGCHSDTTITIVPHLDFSAFQLDTAVCPGESTQFFAVYTGVDPTNVVYSWSPPGGLDDPNADNPVVTITSSPSSYTLSAEDTLAGCSWDTTMTVSWYPEASISFIPNEDEGVAPFTVIFNNTSAAGSGNYVWDFGDSTNTSTDENPIFTYTAPGEYLVTLYGENEFGCPGVWQHLIIVLDEPVIAIPNVFSPNGDGDNDEFAFIDYRGFSSFKFLVFNRWGMEVHSTNSVRDNYVVWKPTTDTPEGTYFYVFEGKGRNGDQVNLEGHITLLR